MWQKCPVCEGTGMVTFYNRCSVCNGKKIISEVDGLPPAEKSKDCHLAQEIKYSSVKFGETQFKTIRRFILKNRLEDPECTLDDLWNKWVNENNL